MSALVGRFLLPYERSVAAEGKETSSTCAKAGVRSKGRPPILNGSRSKHASALKKRKVAKSEMSQRRRLDAATSADDGDNVADKKLHSEFVPDENMSVTSPLAADEASATEAKQLDEAVQSTASVSHAFLLALFVDYRCLFHHLVQRLFGHVLWMHLCGFG